MVDDSMALVEFDEIEREWRNTFRIELETPRLRLRPLRNEDIEWLPDLLCDPEVCRFLWDFADTPERAHKLAQGMIDFDGMRHHFGYWAIQDQHAGEFHGWVELSKLHGWPGPSDEIALSYVLRRHSWGRGIATEAAARLMRHGFEVHELPRVMAMIMSGNVASRRVLEKLGMREKLTRTTDDGVELVYFGIEAEEFRPT
jgi:RimJ/RimL family protein N-acetyltransferase